MSTHFIQLSRFQDINAARCRDGFFPVRNNNTRDAKLRDRRVDRCLMRSVKMGVLVELMGESLKTTTLYP